MAAKKEKKTNKNPLYDNPAIAVIAIGAVLLIVAVVLLLTQGNTPTTTTQQTTTSLASDIPYPNITRVSLEDAKTAYDEGKAVFVDVRSAASYEAVHVTGAVSIPLDELESRLGEIRKDKWVITYCT